MGSSPLEVFEQRNKSFYSTVGGITWYPQEDCVKQEESGPGPTDIGSDTFPPPEMLRLRTLEGFCAWVTGTTRKQFQECAEASVQC